MSYTEIYAFDKNGDAYSYEDVNNAFRRAIAIWEILYKKYCSLLCQDKENLFLNKYKSVWKLYDTNKLTREEKIVLGTTFDNVLVKKENLQEVIDAFEKFDGETNLKEQADILKELINDDNTIAVGWNQTSVCEGWTSKGLYDQETDETLPYNIFKQNDHWFLFDELE